MYSVIIRGFDSFYVLVDVMEWINAKQCAELLGVSTWTVYEWVKAEKIPHYRVGEKLIRFNRLEVEEWLKGKRPAGMYPNRGANCKHNTL